GELVLLNLRSTLKRKSIDESEVCFSIPPSKWTPKDDGSFGRDYDFFETQVNECLNQNIGDIDGFDRSGQKKKGKR
ncbi:hypothetical protein HAX54_029673, partial [Datura stramonium]|nr:hypothetical protein [Datura stramonium]